MMDRNPGGLRLAVERMLPKTKLGRKMIKKLKIYAGEEHPRAAAKACKSRNYRGITMSNYHYGTGGEKLQFLVFL